MYERFDGLARAMAAGHSRRSVLKMMGAAAAAATAATVLKPFRSDAVPVTCSGPTNVGPSPCGVRTTPCGPCCCETGIACLDATNGVCGCPIRSTPCGSACCQKGTACANPSTSTCATAAVACTQGQTVCGTGCCSSGQTCVNGACVSSSVCAGQGNECAIDSGINCPNNDACGCIQTTEDTPACIQRSCGTSCTSSSGCLSNQVCVKDFALCCGDGGFCAPICSTGR